MNLQKFKKFFLNDWIIPLISLGPVLFIFIILGLTRSDPAEIMGLVILGSGLFWLLCSAIYQFIQRNWLKGIGTIIITAIGTFMALIIYGVLLSLLTMIDGDGWADNLTIPDNIQISNPQGEGYGKMRPDSILNIKRSGIDFELYNSFQPGIYHYDLWIEKIERGTIYLKAFEITKDYQLSKDRLTKNSALEIHNPTDSIMRFSTNADFTIYEGDWAKPYAARFEVWFKPANGKAERKLFEKNYKIEGWQH